MGVWRWGLKRGRRDRDGFPDSPEAILACLGAAFEDGHPEAVALALNDAARGKRLARPAEGAKRHRLPIETVTALRLELTVRRA